MTPPQQRRADDGRLDEVVRRLEEVVIRLDRMQTSMETTYVRQDVYARDRENHDLAIGGVKVDIRRLDEQLGTQDERMDQFEADSNRRFRQLVLTIFSAVGGPLTVYLVIRVLSDSAGAM